MKLKKFQGPLLLLLCAFFWGTTFVAQSLGAENVDPFTFNGIRMILGGLVLLPVIAIKNRGRMFAALPEKKDRRALFLHGAVCGVLLFLASSFQQFGISAGTSPGKSGFITAMYVIFVPIAGIFLKKKIKPEIWACIVCAIVGMYLLCMADFESGFQGVLHHFSFSAGDFYTLICAVLFTFHIMAIDRFSPHTDSLWLSCVQFFTAGLIGIVCMFLFEKPTIDGILAGSGAILYSAVLSCGVGYTLQIVGQKTTPPSVAGILMCMESVFAVISDVIILRTAMSEEEIAGCVLMFVAILVSNLSGVSAVKKKKEESV